MRHAVYEVFSALPPLHFLVKLSASNSPLCYYGQAHFSLPHTNYNYSGAIDISLPVDQSASLI